MTPKIDLHTHTLASDGALSPSELVQRAVALEIRLLAITDHDTCGGWREAEQAAQGQPIQLLPGIELSTAWGGLGVHIVGLGIDPDHPAMREAVSHQTEMRQQRAEMIAERMEKRGMSGVYEGAMKVAGNGQIGRPHFARYMVDQGYVASLQEAFDRHLGAGKPGDVKSLWPELKQVVTWILASGGVAVLAHPSKYKLTRTKLKTLIDVFHACGGEAMEVSYGGENPDVLRNMLELARRHQLMVSVGSDFHSPALHWTELGKYPPLKKPYQAVWERWFSETDHSAHAESGNSC
jgi:hypothetical protein